MSPNVMLDLVKNRYAMAANEKRIELVSFRCGENLMNQIEEHCRNHKGLSQSMLVADLVALGLSVFNSMQEGA
jgi:hypothetical protein